MRNINGNGNGNSNGSGSNNNIGMQSFAGFCVSVLLKPAIVLTSDKDDDCQDSSRRDDHDHEHDHHHHKNRIQQMVYTAIEEVANAYISGEAMDGPIEALFERLIQGDVDGDGDGDDGALLPMPSPTPTNPCFSYKRTDLELFQNDLENCLENTLLHEYLSTNWDHIDDLIGVNQKQNINGKSIVRKEENDNATVSTSVNDQEERGRSSAKSSWGKTRKAYFRNKIQDDLKHVRKFTTMTSILRSVQDETKHEDNRKSTVSGKEEESKSKSKHDDVFLHRRRPTVYFLGGGMGAGKSSVVTFLEEKHDEMFENNPVVVEADAFKHSDPVFHALKSFQEKSSSSFSTSNGSTSGSGNNGGEPRVSQLVHEHSTNAANQQLIVALANQRDVVVDGTMTWMPYVQQTIEMVRDAHKHKYLLGPGYSEEKEQYWEKAEAIDEDRLFLPYRVEMVGVTIDPEHAVSRGIRRAIITGRGVPIRGQLRSHRLYSEHFPTYANENNENGSKGLFDQIRLFDNSTTGRTDLSLEGDGSPTNNEMVTDTGSTTTAKKERRPPPRCIAWKESPDQPLSVVPDAYERFLRKQRVNDAATGVADLYKTNGNNDDDANNECVAEVKREPQTPIDNMIHWRLRGAFTIEQS